MKFNGYICIYLYALYTHSISSSVSSGKLHSSVKSLNSSSSFHFHSLHTHTHPAVLYSWKLLILMVGNERRKWIPLKFLCATADDDNFRWKLWLSCVVCEHEKAIRHISHTIISKVALGMMKGMQSDDKIKKERRKVVDDSRRRSRMLKLLIISSPHTKTCCWLYKTLKLAGAIKKNFCKVWITEIQRRVDVWKWVWGVGKVENLSNVMRWVKCSFVGKLRSAQKLINEREKWWKFNESARTSGNNVREKSESERDEWKNVKTISNE